MNDIIIGVTVGTPTSPAKMADEIKPVKTVNGVEPDENGNVEVEGGGGAKSWNELEDKPFGEVFTECGETLAWDGTPTEICVVHGENKYCRVSDSTPTIDKMVGGNMNLGHGVNTYHYELQADYFEQHNAHAVFYNNEDTPFFIVVDADNTVAEVSGESLMFPKKGIYFILTSNGVYVKDITVMGYNFTGVEVKKLDKKYLPDDIGGVNIIVEDSVEQLPDPSTVKEGTIALVTSEG